MLKRLSEHTDDQLAYLLARVREIAALGDEAALIETDKLVWEIMEDQIEGAEPLPITQEDHEAISQSNRMMRVVAMLSRLRISVATNDVSRWDLQRLEEELRAASKSETWVGRESFMQTISPLLDEAWQKALIGVYEKCEAWEFKNKNSVGSMLSELTDTIRMSSALRPRKEENHARVRAIKERGARFRWNKKTSDAEVAEVAGFVGKADGLRKEAKAMLVQDWATMFPGETPP